MAQEKIARQVLCIICGKTADFKYDKKFRPYIWCAHCLTRMFMGSPRAEAGYFLNTELLGPVAVEHQEILEVRLTELLEKKRRNARKRK